MSRVKLNKIVWVTHKDTRVSEKKNHKIGGTNHHSLSNKPQFVFRQNTLLALVICHSHTGTEICHYSSILSCGLVRVKTMLICERVIWPWCAEVIHDCRGWARSRREGRGAKKWMRRVDVELMKTEVCEEEDPLFLCVRWTSHVLLLEAITIWWLEAANLSRINHIKVR